MKKKIFYLALLLFFFCWGILTERDKIFPFKLIDFLKSVSYDKYVSNYTKPSLEVYYKKYPNFLDKKINITKYYNQLNIWNDRIYYNHENDDKLLNLYLIQIARHRTQTINIVSMEDIVIYRPVCELNNNSTYDDWESVDYEIAIVGISCVHNKIFKKKFEKGSISLVSGGPISSDPVFIQNLSNLKSITIK